MTTIREIAAACNVSIATVSNILNGNGKRKASERTQKLVLEKARELNYTPNLVAKNLRLQRTKTLGILIEDMTVFHVPYVVDGITEYCENTGYSQTHVDLRLCSKLGNDYFRKKEFAQSVQNAISELAAKQVDGLIYITSHERVLKCIPEDLGIPAVMVYGYTHSSRYPSFVINDRKGACDAVTAAIKKGHRKIGVITGEKDSIHTRLRLEGYREALEDAAISVREEYIVYGSWSREAGCRCAEILCGQGVTAIFCMSDVIAGGVYDYFHSHDICPGKDISIVGYDDREFASYLYPALTSVRMPLRELGMKACQILINEIRERKEEKMVRVYEANPLLIERDSVETVPE